MLKKVSQRRIERLLLYDKQRGKCYYCGNSMEINQRFCTSPDYATFDHVVAKKHRSWNQEIVLACLRCNRLKGTLDVKQFKELIRWRRFGVSLLSSAPH
jgi:5-methylcytosine-specific restriction endonuclease McrA